MFSRPALVAAICFALGIWAAKMLSINVTFAAVMLVLLLIAAYVRREKRSGYFLPVITLAIVAAGAVLGALSKPSTDADKNLLQFEDNTPHLFCVTCNDDPVEYSDGFSF